jgi:hypothetical protein
MMRMRYHSIIPAALLVCFFADRPGHAADPAGPAGLQSARAILARWVETQEITSRERKEWQQTKEMLTSRIEMMRREIAMVEEQLSQARGEQSQADKARSEVVNERDALAATVKRLGPDVEEMEAKTRRLYRMLPPVLTEKVKPLYDRMPEGPAAAAKVTMAERFQNLLGIQAELNRLNGEVTVATEIRPLSNGKPSEVKTIYIGLAQAYYVSASGEAGIGRPSADGWIWEADPGLAMKINDVLEVLQNKATPHFVPLPVKLD